LQKEIELKLRASNVDEILQRIDALKWRRKEEQTQKDIYYTSSVRDFITTKECLRIRTVDSTSEITWKPPTSAAMREKGQYWKQEVNLAIANQEDVARLLLECLGFIEYITVEKQRQVFEVDKDSIVALDLIKGLGWFVEIETFGEDPEQGTAKNLTIARQLGVENNEQVNTPYRDLVKSLGSILSSVPEIQAN
jgi:adenylate cyclase class 2